MKVTFGLGLVACAAMTFGFGAQARAGGDGKAVVGRPASALIFPLVDSRTGKGTLISITNTNEDRTSCSSSDFRSGDVCLQYTYFANDASRGHCREFDVSECLTPGDTLTVIADQHNPNMEIGWLWVEARDPESFEAIEFDFLIGSAIIVDTGLDFMARYIPYGFRANCTFHVDRCGRGLTDCNSDGAANFGREYDAWPATLFVDSFFQEGGTNPEFTDTIALASCETSGTTFVDSFIWNNRERRFSRDFEFECFFVGTIGDITNVAGNLGGDPNELTSGSRSIQTGWLHLTGENAPILGVFIQKIANTSFGDGDVLEYDGTFPCSLERRG
ncbi:MAG: hypothetical protein HYR85_26755 [Planctomycetes bacterium]|nr:hypothetical protein [Planctomycetota bacterium]MBI3844917.1 hypothetical protein [Planctomycetota bacterium]